MKKLLLLALWLSSELLGQTGRAGDARARRFAEATAAGNIAIVRELLEGGLAADTLLNADGKTALMVAAAEGHSDIVELLLARGADLNAETTDGVTPVLAAMMNIQQATSRLLLKQGARTRVRELVASMYLKDIDLTRSLVKDVRMLNQQSPDFDGDTALTMAIETVSRKPALMLIELGADPNIPQKKTGKTPLQLAQESNYPDVVEALLKAGAKSGPAQATGQLSLIAALEEKNRDLVRQLVKQNASLTAQDKDGATPLVHAARLGFAEEVRLMLQHGADVNGAKGGQVPLFVAAFEEHFEVIRILMEAGADVNARNRDGMTPIFGAVSRVEADLVAFLIAKGADVRVRDADGETLRGRNRRNFDLWMSMQGPGHRTTDPLTGLAKEVDDLLARAGAPR